MHDILRILLVRDHLTDQILVSTRYLGTAQEILQEPREEGYMPSQFQRQLRVLVIKKVGNDINAKANISFIGYVLSSV